MFGKKVKDPVCGMEVDKKAAVTADYNGQAYYFCAPSCREMFQKEPAKYGAASAAHGEHGGHGGHGGRGGCC